MPTNRELEALVEKLSNRVEALEAGKVWEDPKAPEPEPEIEEPTGPQPTPYEREEAAYLEKVRPHLNEWAAAVEAEYQRLCDNHSRHGGTVTKVRERKFRNEATATVKYSGPPPTYYDYLNEQRAIGEHDKSESIRKARTEGLAPGLFRDPFGLIRSAVTNEVVPLD